jgi:UDP-N-acetylglucosamine--N-acetylmuramyl-(pentapeptide) pyrophosphoryl-undecaprenol N-acetylglucosamine transferase
MKNYAVCVAGGTGGHINAAIALGEELKSNDYDVQYITGTRHLDYKLFKNKNAKHINSMPLRFKNPFKVAKSLIYNLFYFKTLIWMFLKKRPEFIIGCGGYICGPTLSAGFILGVPVYVVEQNAVMGLTNRILSFIAKKLFVHFKETKGIKESQKRKIVVSGNPTRSSIKPVDKREGDVFSVLVFGGSLGARQINDIIKFIAQENWSKKVRIYHQVGKGNEFHVNPGKNVEYEQYEYLDNIQEFYSKSQLIISRAGASTISELRILGKPCILVPYPQATDNHQEYNAKNLKDEVKFPVIVINQKDSIENNIQIVKDQLKEFLNEDLGKYPLIEDFPQSSKVIIDEIRSQATI